VAKLRFVLQQCDSRASALKLYILRCLPRASAKTVFLPGIPSPQSQTSDVHSSSIKQIAPPKSIAFPNLPKLTAALLVLSQHFVKTAIIVLNSLLIHVFSSSLYAGIYSSYMPSHRKPSIKCVLFTP